MGEGRGASTYILLVDEAAGDHRGLVGVDDGDESTAETTPPINNNATARRWRPDAQASPSIRNGAQLPYLAKFFVQFRSLFHLSVNILFLLILVTEL